MPLGLTVVIATLTVITVLGVLGYLMDRQVDHEEEEDKDRAKS
jgi:hypothetical protein